MRIRIVTPPTLLGELPGMAAFIESAQQIATKHGADFVDASGEMQDLRYFQDHDHLNAAGVAEFARRFLEPAVD
jgi:lysophospholipase L1-like esterase